MGRNSLKCDCLSCFRAKFKPHHDVPLQPLPKPESADVVDAAVPIEEEEEILIIREIDPCITTNGLHHHTDKFELMTREYDPQLVVRRGQPFTIDLTLSRPYNEEKDGISFIFTVEDEEKSSYGQGTLIALPLMKKSDKSLSWNVVIENVRENVMTVQITPSPESIVAKWRIDIDTRIIDGGAYSYSWATGIYILFNPWCKQDQVYMQSELWKDETVLNEVGLIWRGTFNRLRPVIWKYDQFAKTVLECSLYLAKIVGKVKGTDRNDPVVMTRALAAAVNSADDLGAIMGNWSEDHSGGTAPTKWISSSEILQKYYKKKKPVKYGQCWVFSGVLTTICRALGIPSRPVTNYSSAHDTQNSLTVDYFMNEEGEIMEELNSDSIWNFHVWNEVWMGRPDLGREYNGWQAIDATPQELSDDMYKCGPASVVAVKRGEVKRPYDNSFVFAEVNADKVFWRYSGPTQPLKLLQKDIYGIGKMIITKAAGIFDREDITLTYKYPEKTGEERTTMLKALKQSEHLYSRYYLNEDFNYIHFDFALRDDIKIGKPFEVSLMMTNKSKIDDYKVNVILRVDVVTYRGQVGDLVKKERYNITVKANSVSEVKLPVTFEEYRKKVLHQCAFNISCLANVEETKFEYYAQDDFRVRKPDIKIVLLDKPVEGKECTADILIENSLPIPLKKGEFSVNAPGLEKTIILKVKGSVEPGGNVKSQFKFTPPRTGRYTIGAKFVSKEMDDCDGYLVIMVEPNKSMNSEVNQ